MALSAMLWSSLVLGVVLSAVNATTDQLVALAAVLGATYASIVQFTPRRVRDSELIGELVAVGGVMAALITVAITGGADSGYVLFLAIPSFYAGAFLGRRIGLETAVLTSIGLITVVVTLGPQPASRMPVHSQTLRSSTARRITRLEMLGRFATCRPL